jgi:hypothetical protein
MKPRDIARQIGIETGCGDNSCLWGSPGGMGTNGGCRCAEKGTDPVELRRDLQKALKVVRHLSEQLEIAKATQEEREHDMRLRIRDLRIRAGYDKTIADAWSAKVAEVEAELAVWRKNAEYACENPPADCECPGCGLAREESRRSP